MYAHGNYSYFTRKQANCLYSAFKNGKLNMTKVQTKMLYDLVGKATLTVKEWEIRYQFEKALGWLFKNELEFAQAVLDGKTIEPIFEVTVKPNPFSKTGFAKSREIIGYKIAE